MFACAGGHRWPATTFALPGAKCAVWAHPNPRKGRDACRTAWRNLHSPRVHHNGLRGWRRTSLHRLAAIDDQGVPDDEGGRIRAQPDDGRSDLLGLPHPANRLLRNYPLASLGGAPAEAVHHWGFDDPGTHGVDAEVRRRIVEGRRLGKADDAEFRGAVRGLTGDAFDPGARRRCSRSPHPLA